MTLTKNFKKGLPNYSNLTVGISMTWEIGEGETFDFDQGFDILNQQISLQANDGLEDSWMRTRETTKNYIASVKIPKKE